MSENIAYYENIIFYKGIFYTEKENLKVTSLHNRIHIPYIPTDINLLDNLDNIEEYDKGIILVDGFHDNMGHLLWDVMYPSWYGLFYHKDEDISSDFQWMTTDNMYDQYSDGWHLDIVEKFSGNKITTPKLLSKLYNNPIKISYLIVGSKNIGIGSRNNNFCIGRQLKEHIKDPIESFVNRMYLKYKIERTNFLDVKYNKDSPINIIYAINKREYKNIDLLFQELNIKYSNKCNFQIVEWSKYNFEEQLNIFNSTGIIICGVGTVRTRTPFLPNGAIEIQTNTHSLIPPNYINYNDYYIGTLSKYIKIININEYTLYEAQQNLYSQHLKKYIEDAITNFPNKNIINIEDNIPFDILKIREKCNMKTFEKWRDSLSNDIGELILLCNSNH